jgi:DNA polymerase-3 subunit epsilon
MINNDLSEINKSWKNVTLIGFDTETSGQYPLTAEICEVAAVKWKNGEIVDKFQSFVKTNKRMSDEVIAIHHITNEMLIGAPDITSVVKKFSEFIKGGFLIAHHAPFDLGFLTPEFEKAHLALPENPVFCSSLLARKNITGTVNHKLQTLIGALKLNQGQAHRALDDAQACLDVALYIFNRLDSAQADRSVSVSEILNYQVADLKWPYYSISTLRSNSVYKELILALESQSDIQIIYSGGSRPGQARTVKPLGLVRNPLDDYLVAREENDPIPKRYFLKRITAARF